MLNHGILIESYANLTISYLMSSQIVINPLSKVHFILCLVIVHHFDVHRHFIMLHNIFLRKSWVNKSAKYFQTLQPLAKPNFQILYKETSNSLQLAFKAKNTKKSHQLFIDISYIIWDFIACSCHILVQTGYNIKLFLKDFNGSELAFITCYVRP